MKIDVATPFHIKHIEDMIKTMTNSINNDINRLKSLVYELQDRIKILETKPTAENNMHLARWKELSEMGKESKNETG